MRRLAGAALILAALASAGAAAQDSGGLAIAGAVAHPKTLTPEALRAMPAVTVETDFTTMKGQRHASFTGTPLWGVLNEAGMVDEPGEKTFLRHVIMARGKDGYAVAVAIGELDPNLEGKNAIVAYEEDGKPTEGLRLVVPGDRHGARAVHDLVAIEVK